MRLPSEERRDWTLLILILPLGIIFMLLAGQLAIYLMPSWRVSADISSKVNPSDDLDSNNLPDSIAPVRSDILTPMAWADTFLTPGASVTDTSVVPLVVLNPSATPTSPTIIPQSPSSTSSPITATSTPSSTVTTTVTSATSIPSNATSKPPKNKGDGDGPLPTATSISTATSTSTAPSTATATLTTPITFTPEGTLIANPSSLDVGPPNNNPANIPAGQYTVVDLLGQGGSVVTVTDTSETNYDLIYYEFNSGGNITMDQVIVGISVFSDGNLYYEVFNWGNGNRDTNTNVDTAILGVDSAELDNQSIDVNDLYGSPPDQTGILIDVDNAPSAPPAGDYPYVVIISPAGGGDPAQVDSIEVTEVPP